MNELIIDCPFVEMKYFNTSIIKTSLEKCIDTESKLYDYNNFKHKAVTVIFIDSLFLYFQTIIQNGKKRKQS